MLGVCVGFGYFAPTDIQSKMLVNTAKFFRTLGLSKEHISDNHLIKDYFEKNILAAQNVVLASPSFYFMWHLMHGTKLSVTLARSITGTIRIVPFMGLFYGGFAVIAPWVTSAFMDRGQNYKEAHGNTGLALFLSGFAALEAVVELRGCGVPFSAMSASAFLIFVPFLIGRLAAGVVTQQAKVGTVAEPMLPKEWKTSDESWKRDLFATFETLALDSDFLTTVVGTSIFQHLLNGVTFVLLNKGNANVMRDFMQYLKGGMNGTIGGSMNLFGRTIALRTFFCWTWNYCSAQPRRLEPIEEALRILES